MTVVDSPKFTLRFHKPANHRLLGLLAERYGISKNQLAEEMLERELQAAALMLERDLTGTLALLRRYRRGEHLEQAIDELARAEAYEQEPVPTRMAASAGGRDAFGIADMFA